MSNGTQSKSAGVQKQVDEVIGIMHTNLEKVVTRGEKLETLQAKTDDLEQGALQFKKGATKVRHQMWLKDLRLKLIIAGVVIAILIVIGAPIAAKWDSIQNNGKNQATTPASVPQAVPQAAPPAVPAS